MDGFQRKISQSLQFRLSLWLGMCIFVIGLAAGALSFAIAFHDANEVQDDQLLQVASLLAKNALTISKNTTVDNVLDSNPSSRLVIQQLEPEVDTLSPCLNLVANLTEGIQTVLVKGESWRVVVQKLRSGQRFVVAQQTTVRDEIAWDSRLGTLMPFLVLIPILVLLVRISIRQLFKPIIRLATELDLRNEQDLRGVDDAQIPSEILPFIAAINRLLARVSRSLDIQRRFMAGAAHELRSPLTALSLQAEGLEGTDMSAQARERLHVLRDGLHRAQTLLNQLLALARAQSQPQTEPLGVSAHMIFRQTLETLMPQVEARALDIGVISREDAKVALSATDLSTIVKNLVDNTIRYTPPGGRVDLEVHREGGDVLIFVTDTGPGIPVGERERVFDPFYRVIGNDAYGSGLGLAIVKTIVDQAGGSISLADAASGKQGLRVTVRLPGV